MSPLPKLFRIISVLPKMLQRVTFISIKKCCVVYHYFIYSISAINNTLLCYEDWKLLLLYSLVDNYHTIIPKRKFYNIRTVRKRDGNFSHGSRDTMWSPINWQKSKISN